MRKHDDGGPAFPCTARVTENYMDEGGYGRTRTVSKQVGGMSLRDWFAGQALAGLLANGPHDCDECEVAHDAYLFADAMLSRRLREGSQC